MPRWFTKRNKGKAPRDLQPSPAILRAEPPQPCANPDPRLLAMFDLADPHGIHSWPQLIDWLADRARRLRADKAALQARLARTQAFTRYKP